MGPSLFEDVRLNGNAGNSAVARLITVERSILFSNMLYNLQPGCILQTGVARSQLSVGKLFQ